MRPPVVQMPLHDGASPLHLYRHMLREASYLLPIVSFPVTEHIKRRFRRSHEFKDKVTKDNAAAMARIKTQMRQGRRQLHLLEAANACTPRAVNRIFLLAFGRVGPLRRKFVDQLIVPEAPALSDGYPADPEAEAATSASASASTATKSDQKEAEPADSDTPKSKRHLYPAARRSNRPQRLPADQVYAWARKNPKLRPNFLDRWDFDKLQAYMNGQKTHSGKTRSYNWPHGMIDSTSPTHIAAQNAWGRPTPIRSVRSQLRLWWYKRIGKVQAPLGASEWETLRALAGGSGSSPLLQYPPRRPVAVSRAADDGGEGIWTWEQYARYATSHLVRQQERITSSERIADKASRRPPGKVNRVLRRRVEGVFELCSVVREDEHTLQKGYVWGRVDKPLKTISSRSRLFEGVNDKGIPVPIQPSSEGGHSGDTVSGGTS